MKAINKYQEETYDTETHFQADHRDRSSLLTVVRRISRQADEGGAIQ